MRQSDGQSESIAEGAPSKLKPSPTPVFPSKKKTYKKQPATTPADLLVNPKPDTLMAILKKSGKRALGGGIPGAAAGLIQVREGRSEASAGRVVSYICGQYGEKRSDELKGFDRQ